jgi:hypothetical protein
MTIVNISKVENNTNFEYDFCIIGAGMSGQIIASKIKNRRIALIDSGKIHYNEKLQDLNNIEEKGLKFRNNHTNRLRQLGGSANLWANQIMTVEENEITNRDWIDSDLQWPIKYKDLYENYEAVLKYIHNSSNEDINNFELDNNESFNSILENEFQTKDFFSFRKHFWPKDVEKFNYKSNFTKKILNDDKIDFFENFTATKFKINETKQVLDEITIKSESKTCKIKSKNFILSCGAIENARILLNNQSEYKILQNDNIGKYFMDHARVTLGSIKSKKKLPISILLFMKYRKFDLKKSIQISPNFQKKFEILSGHSYLDPNFGENEDIFFTNFLKEIKKFLKFKGIPNIKISKFNLKKILEQIYFNIPKQISNSFLNNLIRLILKRKQKYLSFNEMNIHYQGEQAPNVYSSIKLSNKLDSNKQKKVIVNWQLKEIDYKSQEQFISLLKKSFNNNDLLTFTENLNQQITDASHHSGTTRMSKNRLSGVVDNNCKFHDLNNVYISGNSVFRTAGSGNPGLTNMALSYRLGEYLNNLSI